MDKRILSKQSKFRSYARKKSVLSVKLDGLKTKQKKRLLLDNIDNLHQMFNEQYPEHKVGCTKFFELHPLWVIPVQKQSQEV